MMDSMDKDELFEKLTSAIVVTLVCIGMAIALFGCKTHYAPVDVHDRDSTHVQIKTDTFWRHTIDSIVTQMPCSDSIEVAYEHVYHSDIIRDKQTIHDTTIVNNTDTIYQPYEVIVEKEIVRNSKFATFCVWHTFAVWAILAIIIAVFITKKIYLRK